MRGAIVFAFDDAVASTDEAFTALHAKGITATVPVPTGHVGGTLDGNTTAGWGLIDSWVAGGWECTNHTRNHLVLTSISLAEVEDEVVGGRDDLIARGYPGKGYDHFVVPQHKTSADIRRIAYKYSKSIRDISGAIGSPDTLPLVTPISSILFNAADLSPVKGYMDLAVRGGEIAFVHTHGADFTPWNNIAEWIESKGYVDDVLTMTQLFERYEWIWDRPLPLLNARPSF